MISAKLSAARTPQPPQRHLPRQCLRAGRRQRRRRQHALVTQSSRRPCRQSTRTNPLAKNGCTLASINTMLIRRPIANGGLKWIQKGGGYYSECNKQLKG